MILNPPFEITPSLMAGLKIGGAWLGLEYANRSRSCGGRTRYHWQLVLADGQKFDGTDLQSGCQGGSIKEGFESLLSFLEAAAESYRHNRNKMEPGSSTDLFPEPVCEWAYQFSDELSLLKMDLEDTESILIEE